MQNQANAVLNALDEGQVSAVISMYENDRLNRTIAGDSRYATLYFLLTEDIGLPAEQVHYWLDWFNIEDDRPDAQLHVNPDLGQW